jgi:hypothetical protein
MVDNLVTQRSKKDKEKRRERLARDAVMPETVNTHSQRETAGCGCASSQVSQHCRCGCG